MALIPTQNPGATGAALTTQAANGGGDQFVNSGKEQLVVVNGGGSPITVTFEAARACSLGSLHDSAANSVPAGQTRYFAAPDRGRYNDAETERVSITYSDVTSVTVGVIVGG